MSPTRLSALDASFLAAETPTAHMHVGWAAVFDPPEAGSRPCFEELREHVAARLRRAPRYRQLLASIPLGVHDPVWVDDPHFAIERHVLDACTGDLRSVIEMAMSTQLERCRPLWELWISDRLADGRIGVVGKAHHCMVDGLAAVELASLMLDPDPHPEPQPADDWRPEPPPSRLALLATGALDRVRDELDVMELPARMALAPRRGLENLAAETRRVLLALGHALGSPAPRTLFNRPGSPLRHLGTVSRPLADLRAIKSRHATTINDVLLAVAAGGVRRFLQRHDQPPLRLKAMMPVSVRQTGGASELGNQISFIFIELPCDQADPVSRLLEINRVTSERKRTGEPRGADNVLKLAAHTPRAVQHALTRLVASPRTFNLVVSNIPGPQQPLYMRGCRLVEAYPIVPLADRHAVAIGFTTIAGRACFGLYADRKMLPDVDLLADDLNDAIDELLPPVRGDGHRHHAQHRVGHRPPTVPA